MRTAIALTCCVMAALFADAAEETLFLSDSRLDMSQCNCDDLCNKLKPEVTEAVCLVVPAADVTEYYHPPVAEEPNKVDVPDYVKLNVGDGPKLNERLFRTKGGLPCYPPDEGEIPPEIVNFGGYETARECGTGCLIGKKMVLTATHVIGGEDGDATDYVCLFDFTEDRYVGATDDFMSFSVYSYYPIVGKYDLPSDVASDVAVVELDRCARTEGAYLGSERKYMEVWTGQGLADALKEPNDELVAYTHSQGLPLIFAWGAASLFQPATNDEGQAIKGGVNHYVDLFAGSSGGPLFAVDHPTIPENAVVGVHVMGKGDYKLTDEGCVIEVLFSTATELVDNPGIFLALEGLDGASFFYDRRTVECPSWRFAYRESKPPTGGGGGTTHDPTMVYVNVPAQATGYCWRWSPEKCSRGDTTTIVRGQNMIRVPEGAIVDFFDLRSNYLTTVYT
ncbi:MAG: trypsin-like serine protease [Chitinivibrionales bacterium]|nr:trypsin-like serine protease [Chitinivibrionales bacterium]